MDSQELYRRIVRRYEEHDPTAERVVDAIFRLVPKR